MKRFTLAAFFLALTFGLSAAHAQSSSDNSTSLLQQFANGLQQVVQQQQDNNNSNPIQDALAQQQAHINAIAERQAQQRADEAAAQAAAQQRANSSNDNSTSSGPNCSAHVRRCGCGNLACIVAEHKTSMDFQNGFSW